MISLIRIANAGDADEISQVIIASLRQSNAKDYSEEIITRVEQSFSPATVSKLLVLRTVFVAVDGSKIVGTASLDDRVVRTVFIDPGCQGRGIGRALMAEVERVAGERGIEVLAVPSSVTAEPFYAKLGYKPVRDSFHGEERTIIMERNLASPSADR